MYLTSTRPEQSHSLVVGGFIQVNRKVWKGVIRDKDTNALLWQCDHVHSRPEYNSRSIMVDDDVWEYSALNCGIEAEHQWRRKQDPEGVIGRVGHGYVHDVRRDDTKVAEVGVHGYIGHISLREDGYRQLKVSSLGVDDLASGHIILEKKKDDSLHPHDAPSLAYARWLMAAVLLEGDVWGVIFRDPKRKAKVNEVDYEAIRRFIPKRKPQSSHGAFVRPVRQDGKRRYEVVDANSRVVHTVAHRGRAAKLLQEIEEKA